MADRVHRRLGTIGKIEFAQDVRDVVFHRFFRDEKLLADFFVGVSVDDELEDLLFSFREWLP